MVLAAPATDRVLVEYSHAGHGLAGVEHLHFRTLHLVDKSPRECRDSAHVLQQIENHALAGENDTGIVTNYGDRLPRPQTNAIEDLRMADDLEAPRLADVILGEDFEEARNAAHSSEDTLLLSDDGARGPQRGIDSDPRRRVFSCLVFTQRLFEGSAVTRLLFQSIIFSRDCGRYTCDSRLARVALVFAIGTVSSSGPLLQTLDNVRRSTGEESFIS